MDYINDDYVTNRLKQPKQGINEIIRQIHFNPGRPENHYIKITNKKLPYASVFKNNTWELDDKENHQPNDSQKAMESWIVCIMINRMN